MGLVWRKHHFDEAYKGLDGRGMLAGGVVRYQGDGRWFWAAFVRQERVPGEWPSAEEAMAVVDRHR